MNIDINIYTPPDDTRQDPLKLASWVNSLDKLTAGLYYAKVRGWPVFPIHSRDVLTGCCTCGNPECYDTAKHPLWIKGLFEHGFKSATNDPELIWEVFQEYPWANIGIATGRESNLAILDADDLKLNNSFLRELFTGSFFTTISEDQLTMAQSGRVGAIGAHFYFRLNRSLRSVSGIQEKLDLKSDGGYIIAAPSVHRSGRPYRWIMLREQLPALPTKIDPYVQRMTSRPSKPHDGEFKRSRKYRGITVEWVCSKFTVRGQTQESDGTIRIRIDCPAPSHKHGGKNDGCWTFFPNGNPAYYCFGDCSYMKGDANVSGNR